MNKPDRNTVTILYVDDEELACKYFVRAVETDYDVLTASSVDAALAILEDPHNQVDVLVTDYRMPGRAGGELLRQVEQCYPHIVRILVTAYADMDILLETVNAGEIFRILEKPLNMADVRSTLRLASQRAHERSARRQSLMAIEETLAFLAHELNTPLAAIANFARGIQRRTSGDAGTPLPMQAEIRNAATLMHDNARYCLSVLATFVDSVKNASSVATKNRSGKANSSACQLISSLLDTYPLTPAQRVMIETDVRQDFPITALPNCVALVLSSVLSNALRALSKQPAPALCFTVLVDGNPQIRITDNGPGIPPEILHRLLVDPVTMHADAGGSGWGMIFCNRIMQSFGGNIQIQSEPAQYTTVTLNFPAIKEAYR